MGKKEIKPRLELRLKISKRIWKIRLYGHSDFTKLYNQCMGVTEYCHKTRDLSINFRGPKVSKDTIAHELLHAYCSYYYFHPKLKAEKVEEKICEIAGKKYKTLYNLTNKIYDLFKRKK